VWGHGIIAQLELRDNDHYGKRKQLSQERNQEAEEEQEKIVLKAPAGSGGFCYSNILQNVRMLWRKQFFRFAPPDFS
jgi:hypothetical protein